MFDIITQNVSFLSSYSQPDDTPAAFSRGAGPRSYTPRSGGSAAQAAGGAAEEVTGGGRTHHVAGTGEHEYQGSECEAFSYAEVDEES